MAVVVVDGSWARQLLLLWVVECGKGEKAWRKEKLLRRPWRRERYRSLSLVGRWVDRREGGGLGHLSGWTEEVEAIVEQWGEWRRGGRRWTAHQQLISTGDLVLLDLVLVFRPEFRPVEEGCWVEGGGCSGQIGRHGGGVVVVTCKVAQVSGWEEQLT